MLLQQQLPHLTPVATKFPWTHSIQASPAPRTTYVEYYNKKNRISLPDTPKKKHSIYSEITVMFMLNLSA